MNKQNHPVQVDNVVFLNGKPPQDALAAIAHQHVTDEKELQARLERFRSTLARHGRPNNKQHLEIHYGLRWSDFLAAGDGILRRAQWFLQDGDLPIIEGHGRDIDGWWCEGGDQILFHVPFGNGLTIKETACLLAESANPSPSLVDAIEQLFDDHKDDTGLDLPKSAITLLPSPVLEHISPSFTLNHREARLERHYGNDEEQGRVFKVWEGWTLKNLQEKAWAFGIN